MTEFRFIGAVVEKKANGPAAVGQIGTQLVFVFAGEALYVLHFHSHEVVHNQVYSTGAHDAALVTAVNRVFSADVVAARVGGVHCVKGMDDGLSNMARRPMKAMCAIMC